jgi:hypothetical protein
VNTCSKIVVKQQDGVTVAIYGPPQPAPTE